MKHYLAIFKEENSEEETFKMFSSVDGYKKFKEENPSYTYFGLYEKICE